MKSIMQNDKECYLCGATHNLEMHHIIEGTANRKNSEEQGLKVWLCQECHKGNDGVHKNAMKAINLKKEAEIMWLQYDWARSIQDFVNIFGKNYL